MSHGYVEIAGTQRLITTRGRVSVTPAGQFAHDDPAAYTWFTIVAASSAVWLLAAAEAPTAWVAAANGVVTARLVAGRRLPIVFSRTGVQFASRHARHAFEVVLDRPLYVAAPHGRPQSAPGAVHLRLNTEQRLMLLVLAENTLKLGSTVATGIPTTSDAAYRLGWTATKLSRKLDNLCRRLEQLGVGGVHGESHRLAVHRRSVVVEFAVANGLITVDDLDELDDLPGGRC